VPGERLEVPGESPGAVARDVAHGRPEAASAVPRERLVPASPVGESSRVVVFACGDPLRGDDSVASLAVRQLPPEALARAEVKLVGALEPEYLRDLPAGVRAVIVDAVVGPAPGEIVSMDLAEMSGRAATVVTISSHQLPLDKVVALAQLLRDEPVEGCFVGVGIESVSIGEELSGAVTAAIPALRDAVARAVAGSGAPAGPG
jgi:hydrogenase maturation protease